MPMTIIGLFAGLLIAVAASAGGFTGFLLALVLGAIGYLLGGQSEGRLDIGEIVRTRRK